MVELQLKHDERGFFARTFCREEFTAAGLEPLVEQCNVSFNHRAGTLRGMHYQVAPATEAKLVRCTAGAIVDQIVDMRPESDTYLRSFAVELTAANRVALYVPPMFAHGYQALTDGAEVSYQVSEAYTPGTERGLRHDDPALGLTWPLPVSVLSDKDGSWPLMEVTAAC
ncbi:MAG: dTDP-4-dehydrorhamnose 3,5-epimerase [Frankiales bacterium]|nr:dTDP-4-dehydrorhamnose 3,5-epimerase [Frankiales bacterium]